MLATKKIKLTKRQRIAVMSSFLIEALFIIAKSLNEPFYQGLLFSDPMEVRQALGASDAGSYVQGGIDIANHYIPQSSLWIFRLWPPGMSILFALMIKANLPLMLGVILFNAFGLSLCCCLTIFPLIKACKWFAASLFMAAWSLSPFMFDWFTGKGILFSETAATICTVLSLCFAYYYDASSKKTTEVKYYYLYVSLFMLGISVSFRFMMMPVVLCLIGIFMMKFSYVKREKIYRFLGHIKRQLYFFKSGSRIYYKSFKNDGELQICRKQILVCLCALSFSILPVFIFKIAINDPMTFENNPVTSTSYVWQHRWMTSAQLRSVGGEFIARGGGNWACTLSPIECANISRLNSNNSPLNDSILKEEALRVAFLNPVQFIKIRFISFVAGWNSLPSDSLVKQTAKSDGILSIVLFSICLFLLYLGFGSNLVVLNALVLSIILGTIISLFTSHIESRYFIIIKVAILVWLALLWANGKKPFCNDKDFVS